MIKVIPATIEHIFEFQDNARSIDIEEVEVASGESFNSLLPSLIYSIDKVQAVIDIETGEVLGIGGIEPTRNLSVGAIWLLMTNAVESRKVEFLRFSRKYLKTLLEDCECLMNVVYNKNKLHVSWLNWLGAEWVEQNELFSMFIITRKR
jgi:hypothetical protein